jgi:hypothetical protein
MSRSPFFFELPKLMTERKKMASLREVFNRFLDSHQIAPPKTRKETEEFPGLAVCAGDICVGFIVHSDGRPILPSTPFTALDKGTFDEETGILRINFGNEELYEVRPDEYYEAKSHPLEFFDRCGRMPLMLSIESRDLDADPDSELEYHAVAMAVEVDGKLLIPKLNRRRCTVTKETYSDGSSNWSVNCMGKMWYFPLTAKMPKDSQPHSFPIDQEEREILDA